MSESKHLFKCSFAFLCKPCHLTIFSIKILDFFVFIVKISLFIREINLLSVIYMSNIFLQVYIWLWLCVFNVRKCINLLLIDSKCWVSSKSFLYSHIKKKYKELLVWAKMECFIPPRAFPLQLRNPGYNTTNKLRKTLKGGKKSNFPGTWNMTTQGRSLGFLTASLISQTGPGRNLKPRIANRYR